MNLNEKIAMLKNLNTEVGEELCNKLNEVVELANKAGVNIVDPDDVGTFVTEFNYDPDTVGIYITWDSIN